MRKAKRASPKLDIKFNASIVSEYDFERWTEEIFDELYKRLSKNYEIDKYDSTNLRYLIMAEVDKRIGDLLSDFEGSGSRIIILVKEETPDGYLCDIMTPSYFYLLIVNTLDKALSEKLLGESEKVEVDI
jgi:hypothetical protein